MQDDIIWDDVRDGPFCFCPRLVLFSPPQWILSTPNEVKSKIHLICELGGTNLSNLNFLLWNTEKIMHILKCLAFFSVQNSTNTTLKQMPLLFSGNIF